jgi:hypothetical protein
MQLRVDEIRWFGVQAVSSRWSPKTVRRSQTVSSTYATRAQGAAWKRAHRQGRSVAGSQPGALKLLYARGSEEVWRLACWLGMARDRIGLTAASRSFRAACLRWSFSTACAHADAFAVAATSLGCLLLSFAANCGSARRCVRTLMAPDWGWVVAPLVEIGSAPKTTCCATCKQPAHLKMCRSIGGAQRIVSPTITCIRRSSAPHARHRMTLLPIPGTSSFRLRKCQAIAADWRQSRSAVLAAGSEGARGALGTTSPHPKIKQSRRVFSDVFEMR